jgi:transposase InsO family protein
VSGHKNAPLTPEGRRRLCERIDNGRPLSHVADEGGISRAALTKWYKRWLAYGEDGLLDRTSRPNRQPTRTDTDIEEMVVQLRTHEKWGPDRIAAYLATVGDGSIIVSDTTVWRILDRHGIGRLRDLDMPTGESKRDPNRYEHPHPGDMVHVDVKKVGRIPDGGGWAIHGRGTEEAKASRRVANHRRGYAYIHAAVDDHSRLAYVEVHDDEKQGTAAAFWLRAVLFFREHGITSIKRCLTDNGPAYRSKVFNEALAGTGTTHKYTKPHTPRTNGKVERFNLTMKVEWLYVRPYASDDDRTAALAAFLNEYNHERPHSSLGNKPPASRVPVTTYRMQPQPKVLDVPQVEGLGHEPTLFDLL